MNKPDYETYRVVSIYNEATRKMINVRVDLTLKADLLAKRLVRKAWRNASKRSAMLGGAVVAEVREWNA